MMNGGKMVARRWRSQACYCFQSMFISKNMNKNKVFYVWSEELIKACDRLPAVAGRASLVHGLLQAYGLMQQVKVVNSKPATYSDLREFHSELYLDHLKTYAEVDDDYMSTEEDEEYGLGYDCPLVSDMYNLVATIAGGSITAAKSLVLGLADVAINWCGGWHHANRHGAEGFCYVNDIVIAIETLRKKFPKVLYIDLDVHHGNGVEDAYNLSKSVYTLSLHKHEPGFYPGTGALQDIGSLVGRGYATNVPLHAAYSDDTMDYVFERVLSQVTRRFSADAFVVQCGADALARDPHGGANLTPGSLVRAVTGVLDRRKPTLLLGGGGYNYANASRLWCQVTAAAAGVPLDDDIPDHDYWLEYGPSHRLDVQPTLLRDANSRGYLDDCLRVIEDNLDKYFPKDNAVKIS